MHAFVVRIRDDEGRPMPGVRIEDCGPKIGLNGVDNGRIWFDGVRVAAHRPARPLRRGHRGRPLLLRHRERRTGGSSPCSAPWCRAGCASAGPASTPSKVALAIAIEYAHHRRQFGNPGSGHRGGAARLRHAPAPAVPAARPHLRAALRPGAGRRRPARGVLRHRGRRRRRAGAPGAGVAGRRHQGARHLARVAGRSRSAARPAAARATCR